MTTSVGSDHCGVGASGEKAVTATEYSDAVLTHSHKLHTHPHLTHTRTSHTSTLYTLSLLAQNLCLYIHFFSLHF